MTKEQRTFLIVVAIVCTIFSLVEVVILYMIGFTQVKDFLYQLFLMAVLDVMQIAFMMVLQRFPK